MQSVRRYLHASFAASGARVVEMSDGSLLMHDCPEWTGVHARRLLARYPDAEIDVRACSGSLSGFAVAVRRPARAGLLAAMALLALLLAAAVHVLLRLGPG